MIFFRKMHLLLCRMNIINPLVRICRGAISSYHSMTVPDKWRCWYIWYKICILNGICTRTRLLPVVFFSRNLITSCGCWITICVSNMYCPDMKWLEIIYLISHISLSIDMRFKVFYQSLGNQDYNRNIRSISCLPDSVISGITMLQTGVPLPI